MSEKDNPKRRQSRRGTPKKGEPEIVLPHSGLAEDILENAEVDTAETDETPGEPPTEEPLADNGTRPTPEPPTGPHRIFDFADSLGDEQHPAEQVKRERPETWVTFELGDEIFALPVSHVQEILRVNSITQVPHAPRPVRGVTNKRGRVLPVVDLRVRLDLPEVEITRKSRILVVESRRRLLGLLVDSVDKVVRITRSEVQPPPPDVMTAQSDYILGVCQMDDTLAILLDVDRVLVIAHPQHHAAV